MALYFASQGAGRLAWPLVAGLLRVIAALGGGWVWLLLTGSLGGMFAALALGLLLYGGVNAAAIHGGAWFNRGEG